MTSGPTGGAHAAPDPATGRRRAVLTWLTALFALAVPIAVVAVLGAQVARTGNVSHWPWEEHGFFGWWLVPLSLWIAAACAVLRARPGPAGLLAKALAALAAVTSVALLYNP